MRRSGSARFRTQLSPDPRSTKESHAFIFKGLSARAISTFVYTDLSVDLLENAKFLGENPPRWPPSTPTYLPT